MSEKKETQHNGVGDGVVMKGYDHKPGTKISAIFVLGLRLRLPAHSTRRLSGRIKMKKIRNNETPRQGLFIINRLIPSVRYLLPQSVSKMK